MKSTYKAVEVSAPGILRVVERSVPEPGVGQVRIRVEACGICHTDAATVTGIFPGLALPRVPGHEVVGRIEALGAGVSRWKIGQRVGVGFIAGEDGVCGGYSISLIRRAYNLRNGSSCVVSIAAT